LKKHVSGQAAVAPQQGDPQILAAKELAAAPKEEKSGIHDAWRHHPWGMERCISSTPRTSTSLPGQT
jgi:hypothetical protein